MTEHLLERAAPADLPHRDDAHHRSVADQTGTDRSGPDQVDTTRVDENRLHSEIAGALMSIVRQYSGIKARLADTPEGEMHLSVLLGKVSAHGPLRSGDLADRICADPSTVSRQVAALVKGGFLERRADPDDGRASLLVVTDQGRARLAEHEVRRGLATAPVLSGWTLHDRTELLRLVGRYAADLHQHRDEIVSLLAGGAPTGRPYPAGAGDAPPVPRTAPDPHPGPDPHPTPSSVAPAPHVPARSTGTEEER